MKNILFYLSLLILVMSCSCTRKSTTDASQVNEEEPIDLPTVHLAGQWYIDNIVFNDSLYVRPEEEVPGSEQYMTFEEDTYSIVTNCNVISGVYTIKGDSIHFDDGAITEMACDNMVTENALRKILPAITKIDVTNDSIVRLNSTIPTSYIVLSKSPIQVKCYVE